MLTKLKALVLRRPAEDQPIIKLMKLILRECVLAGADTVVFGSPPNDLPKEPLPHRRTPVDSDDGFQSKSWPSFRWDQVRMPVWFKTGKAWKEVECIPYRLILQFYTTLEESSSMLGDSRPFLVSHVDVGDRDGGKLFIQYEFSIEENFCFSIHILDVAKGTSGNVRTG